MTAYAFGMWLLVFGLMGSFHHFFHRPTPAMRYLADSSYWLYIVHLNVLFLLGIWVADVPMTWPIKLTFYCVAAMVIMIPSYHWLVRSTLIGQILNGRRYPYVPLLQSPLFDWKRGASDASVGGDRAVDGRQLMPQSHLFVRTPVVAGAEVVDTISDPT